MFEGPDVVREIGSVGRRVSRRAFGTGEARVVTISRVYDSPQEDLWDACTNPERIPRWFLPVSGELRPGGRFRLQGNASGTIERCDPPEGFFATWEFGDEVNWIELRLTAVGEGRTRFELDHIAQVDDERWAEFGPGAVGVGWDMGLLGLSRHLATGTSADPAAAMAWLASDEGRRFVALSSEAWGEANVAGGEPGESARAAAARTTAAYTAG
ncbi:SRPBCC family protein [Streptomyces sp. NPDC096198]|uniref:SRPBCC family protein n=1 Tax=Streptomyces sp. NPDC096198 TaxID=3366080 RepID=UPI0037F5DA36